MQPVSGVFSPLEPGLFGLAVYGGLVVATVLVFLALSAGLGAGKKTPEKLRPYECGVIPTGTAYLRYPVPFYLVAVFFLVFDVEGVYIFSWAAAFSDLGWAGWLRMTVFIILLLFSLFYVWAKGGLDWGAKGRPKGPTTSS